MFDSRGVTPSGTASLATPSQQTTLRNVAGAEQVIKGAIDTISIAMLIEKLFLLRG